MSVYKYPESKVIDEITFQTTEKGTVRAYLHGAVAAQPAVFTDIIKTLRAENWQCIPYTIDKKPVLEVRSFGRESKLIKLLSANQWISGQADFKQTADENVGFTDRWKKRSLQAAGILYAWGDASFVAYGWKGKSPLDVAAGVFYGLPTPVLMAYGKNDQADLQIKDAARQLRDYMKTEGDKLPENCAVEAIAADHKKGLLKTADDLFRRYPSEVMNICYAVAGACIFKAGLNHLNANHVSDKAVGEWLASMQKTSPNTTRDMAKAAAIKSMRTENYFNLGVGAATTASGIFGTIVREKAHDPDAPKKTGVSGAWEWVREHPLSIAAGGYMVSTLLHAVSTAVAMKGHDASHKESVVWRASFVASALLAEIMVAISSKGHGEGVLSDKSVDTSIVALAADLIVKQPDHRQEYLINYIAKFLSKPEVLAIDEKVITNQLRQQVEVLRKNPWAVDSTENKDSAKTNTISQNAMQWQTKVSAQSSAGSQPQLSS